jgi:hypothetical protein
MQIKGNSISENTIQEIIDVVTEPQEDARLNSNQFVKLKENTIRQLVDYGVENLPMLSNRSHVRENILSKKEAKILGYSIVNKHYHNLGIRKYIKIIESIDNPKAIYQYTKKGKYTENNFIVLTSISINNNKVIVPIEINKKGQYNKKEIKYNKIKTVYAKTDNYYIDRLLKNKKIKEIFAGSNSQKTSLLEDNIHHTNIKVNKNKTGVRK